MPVDERLSVVIATRDRAAELDRALGRLSELRPTPPAIVVDNGSRASTGWLHQHPARPEVVALPRNLGAAARTVGARRARTPYIAFCDDDSWWEPGALTRAADLFDRHPGLGLIAGRTVVGPASQPDPLNRLLAESPLPDRHPGVPGVPVLGCLACAAVVRRSAFLAVNGFHELLMVGGEEALLCYDLAAAGWAIRYLPEIVAHHEPSPHRPPPRRRQATERRNRVLVQWMRRPLPVAAAGTLGLARSSPRDPVDRLALAGLIRRLPVALAGRRRLPTSLEHDIRLLERADPSPPRGRLRRSRPGSSVGMSILSRTLDATESLERVDPVATFAQQRVQRVLPQNRPLSRILGGSSLGHPLHPVLVLLPLGSWLSATLLDLLPGQEQAARKLVLAGLLTAPPAAIAGAADFRQLGPRPRRVGFLHAISNTAAIGCFTASYLARRSGRMSAGKLWGMLGMAAVGFGGALGGHLSYAHGVGVYRWQPERRASLDGHGG